jgi:acetoin utilization deacetylase AcuC-like enzyme
MPTRAVSAMRRGMQCFTHADYTLPLPEKHRFPMHRYEAVRARLAERLEACAPADRPLLRIVDTPRLASLEEVAAVHCPEFVDAFVRGELDEKAVRKIGFPWSDQFVQRTHRITGATLQATESLLRDAAGDPGACLVAGNLAGGTHHAFRAHGEGFCVYNDIAVAAHAALHAGAGARTPGESRAFVQRADRVLSVDLDVHQGNGTAAMLAADPRCFTLSVHADSNYPWKSRVPGDLDVALPDDCDGPRYCAAVEASLARLEDAVEARLATDDDDRGRGGARGDVGPRGTRGDVGPRGTRGDVGPRGTRGGGRGGNSKFPPPPLELVIFQAGADPLAEDRLGRLTLSRDDLRRRNDVLFDWVARRRRRLGVDTRVLVLMGGGYSDPIGPSVEAHCDVFWQAAEAMCALGGPDAEAEPGEVRCARVL